MTPNKLYAQCRREANNRILITGDVHYPEVVAQLTAEIYGMKLLERSQPMDFEKDYYLVGGSKWHVTNYNTSETTTIGTTQQLHDHFVEQFNKEVGNG